MLQKHSASLVAGIFKKEVIKSPEERSELQGPTTTKFSPCGGLPSPLESLCRAPGEGS